MQTERERGGGGGFERKKRIKKIIKYCEGKLKKEIKKKGSEKYGILGLETLGNDVLCLVYIQGGAEPTDTFQI